MSSASNSGDTPAVLLPDDSKSAAPGSVKGNAPPALKAKMARMHERFKYPTAFANDVYKRLQLTEVSIIKFSEEPGREMGKVVFEGQVDEDMCNPGGNMHGGCAAFLVDMCTSQPLALMNLAKGNSPWSGVSQAINTTYHAPLPLGCGMKVVSTSTTMGSRILTARCEIWDTTNHRLAVSGTHVKMSPSPAPSAKL